MVFVAGLLHTVSAVGLSDVMKGGAMFAGALLQIEFASWFF